MILILSERNDISTDYAVEWFNYFGIPILRLNEDSSSNLLHTVELSNNNQSICFNISGKIVSLNEISGVWFRRGYFHFFSKFLDFSTQDSQINRKIESYINNENKTITEFIVANLIQKKTLSDPFFYNANKLISLQIATKAGLKTPHTLVGRTQEDLEIIQKKIGYKNMITKTIQDIYAIKINGNLQSQYTEDIKNIAVPDTFYYSLFQEKICKKYELRVFFIESAFYACSIFSKSTDGRDLGEGDLLTRIAPYSLPKLVKDKLIDFCRFSNLNTGSIDMLVDHNGDYYFLEVNPVGQYDYVSKSCNYYLDKKIVNFFKNER